MKCTKCGLEKPNFHFILLWNIHTKEFFVNPDADSSQCYDCNGPYRCIICNQVKEASEFRVGGRVCHACKPPTIKRRTTKERRL